MIVLGIDPGKSGAIVALTTEPREDCIIDYVVNLEYEANIVKFLQEIQNQASSLHTGIHAFLEKAQAMPYQGTVSMFNYGVHFGFIKGALYTLGIPTTLVPPQTWTKKMHMGTTVVHKDKKVRTKKDGGSKTKKVIDSKARSLEAATLLFPGLDFRVKAPNGKTPSKPHDGFIDALLIAAYGTDILGKC